MRVAIQGDQASFHELAAKEYYSELPTFMYCSTFNEVFEALSKGMVDRGFVATKNSGHGMIEETKVLIDSYSPIIEGEYDYKVRQHLVGTPESKITDIENVISHPVALSQCHSYLKQYVQNEYYDTAAAMQYVRDLGDMSFAAVGGEEAAVLHGLIILKRDIQDLEDNVTTFASIKFIKN